MYVPIVFIILSLPFTPYFYLSPSLLVALLCAIIPTMNGAAYVAPAFAVTQALVPLRMRAQAAAILLFILNIIGFGLGPPTVGEISELLKQYLSLGVDSIRWAMMTTMLPWAVSAWCYWRASRTLKDDLARGSGTASVAAVA